MNLRIGCDLVSAGFQLRVACSVGADARPAFVCTLRSIGLRTERPPFRRTENPRIRDLRGTTPRFDHVSRRMSKTKSRSVSTPAYGASMIQRSLYVEASSAPRTCNSAANGRSKQSGRETLCAASLFVSSNCWLCGRRLDDGMADRLGDGHRAGARIAPMGWPSRGSPRRCRWDGGRRSPPRRRGGAVAHGQSKRARASATRETTSRSTSFF